MDKCRIKLTEQGKEKVEAFVENLEIKRSELIHAGFADRDDETVIPDLDDIICDIAEWVDDDGEYANCWCATDNDVPELLKLSEGEDFIIKKEAEASYD